MTILLSPMFAEPSVTRERVMEGVLVAEGFQGNGTRRGPLLAGPGLKGERVRGACWAHFLTARCSNIQIGMSERA